MQAKGYQDRENYLAAVLLSGRPLCRMARAIWEGASLAPRGQSDQPTTIADASNAYRRGGRRAILVGAAGLAPGSENLGHA